MKVSFYESCKVCCKKLVETIVLEAFYKSFVARCPKRTLYPHNRVESENKIEVMPFIKRMAENNLSNLDTPGYGQYIISVFQLHFVYRS